jgi:translation initiation factor 2 subunit 2
MEDNNDVHSINDLNFSLIKKKKKKNLQNLEENINQNITENKEEDYTYSYEELLKNIYDKLTQNNINLNNTKKLILKLPMVIRINSNKSIWINFNDFCQTVNREHRYVIIQVEKKLNLITSITKNSELILHNKIISYTIKNFIREFIKNHVQCHTCKSFDTYINKNREIRLLFIVCNNCLSRRSIN